MAKLFRTDGKVKEITPKNGTDFQLEELYEALDCGCIDVIRIPGTSDIVIIDDEGKFSEKGINERLTYRLRYKGAIFSDDFIVGDAIVCDDSELL